MTAPSSLGGSSLGGSSGEERAFGEGTSPAGRASSADGPATVINLERRPPESGGPQSVDSQVRRRLFPVESDDESTPPIAGPEGVVLEHFQITERIGYGGMGGVFRARDLRLGRDVALKVMSPAHSRDPGCVRRFHNEARASARLDHDNIARVFYVGEAQGLYFIAYEFVHGTNVRDLIRQSGRLAPADAVNYTLQIASALNHTWAAGLVHRDIKPSNIIITPLGRAKLVDLGLARSAAAADGRGELTSAGTTLGTFDYISPEQARDPREVDVRSDIYSLGCTLYHMLTGEPPYPEGTVLQKLLDHQGKAPPDPARKNPRIPPALSMVVRKMMASDPRHRYRTPEDLIRDLMPVAGHLGLRGINPEGLIWASPKTTRMPFWMRNLGWIATAAVLVAIVIVLENYPGQDPGSGSDAHRESPLVSSTAGPHKQQGRLASKGASPRSRNDASGTGPGTDSPARGSEDPGGQSPPADRTNSAETAGEAGEEPVPPVHPWPIDKSNGAEGVVARPEEGATSGAKKKKAGEAPPGETTTEPATDSTQIAKKQAGGTPSPGDTGHSVAGATEPNEKVALPPPEISIIADGVPTSYRTLKAACDAARDGDVIVLAFNGRRTDANGPVVEKPVRIDKQLTIRAKNGYRPVLEFAVEEIPGEGYQTRMITVFGGPVNLVDVELRMRVDQQVRLVDGQRWALFSLQGSERITLRGVNVTVMNPDSVWAAVVELASSRTPDPARMKTAKMGGEVSVPRNFAIRLDGCFVRGGCDLVVSNNTRSGRIELRGSAVAVDGALLVCSGDDDMPAASDPLQLGLEHTTCVLGGGLLRMDRGQNPTRFLLPVHVTAWNNIIAGRESAAAPLIAMSGGTNAEDFRRKLQWSGSRNFYDGFPTFWKISPAAGPETFSPAGDEPVTLDFAEWKRDPGTNDDEPSNGPIGWKAAPLRADFHKLTRRELQLDRETSGAAEAGNVGADWRELRPFVEERAAVSPAGADDRSPTYVPVEQAGEQPAPEPMGTAQRAGEQEQERSLAAGSGESEDWNSE